MKGWWQARGSSQHSEPYAARTAHQRLDDRQRGSAGLRCAPTRYWLLPLYRVAANTGLQILGTMPDGRRNDTCASKLIPQVDENVVNLGKLFLLMRWQDIAKACSAWHAGRLRR